MAVERVACARRNNDRLQPYLAGRVFLERHLEIGLGLKPRPLWFRRLRPRRGRQSGCCDDGRNDQLVHGLLPWFAVNGNDALHKSTERVGWVERLRNPSWGKPPLNGL